MFAWRLASSLFQYQRISARKQSKPVPLTPFLKKFALHGVAFCANGNTLKLFYTAIKLIDDEESLQLRVKIAEATLLREKRYCLYCKQHYYVSFLF